MPRPRQAHLLKTPLPATPRVGEAFLRLGKARALQTLVRGSIPKGTLRRLLKDAMPRTLAREMPDEIWAALATGIAVEHAEFGMMLAEAIHDRLAWDQEPADMDTWWQVVRERPLEALWMAACSDSKLVKKEFTHIVEHAVENYRASPECTPPSWEFVDGILDLQTGVLRDMREAEKTAEDAERRQAADRERLEELRDELRRLRRENSETRSHAAAAGRKVEALASEASARDASEERRRAEELERRLRKVDKEREHLARETERLRGMLEARARASPAPPATTEPSVPPPEDPPLASAEPGPAGSPLSLDPNPRRRAVRQILRKLVKKGKIGASHTHEDNVYRGFADHEKGIAKEAMDLLNREGFLMAKPTVTDPHVSLRPERLAETRAIVAGEFANPRLRRWIDG